MMVFNGLVIGGIGGAWHQAGMSRELWSFVMPHGTLELPAIFLAGGGGLLIARGLIFPGLLKRRDAIQLYGGQAVRLALGTIPLLVVAGLIEGFLSPSALPVAAKFGLGAVNALLLVWYLWKGGEVRANEVRAVPAL